RVVREPFRPLLCKHTPRSGVANLVECARTVLYAACVAQLPARGLIVAQSNQPQPTVLVIFGAGGSLTWRKLIPAIYHLSKDGWLDDRFAVIGMDRKALSNDEYRANLCSKIAEPCRT